MKSKLLVILIAAGRPFFCGRDGIKKDRLSEVERERRSGYAWYGDWGEDVADAYAKWKEKWVPAEIAS